MIRRVYSTPSRCLVQQVAAALCATLLGLGGCGTGDKPEDGDRTGIGAAGVSRTAGGGPVSLTLTATPARLDFSEDCRAKVALEVVAEMGVTVEVADYEQALREGDRRFEYYVAGSDVTLAEPTPGGRLRWTYGYELGFFLPGEYELPVASVSFVDMRNVDGKPDARAPAEVQELTTEPLTIVVDPQTDEVLSEEELRKIPLLSPVELPSAWTRLWWLTPLIAIGFAGGALLLVRRLRARRAERIAILPPHEWAQSQLAALAVEDLIGKGLIQQFHYRVSDIVRGYIERRFAVSAPEMTTEEFLATAASDPRFTVPARDTGETVATELRRFLTACDLVKYARHEPAQAKCEAVLETAGAFIKQTREDALPAPTPQHAGAAAESHPRPSRRL